MSETFGILAGRGLEILGNARLRIVLITLGILIALAAVGVGLAYTMHPHTTAPVAGGTIWVETE
jgi:hypothetical protein